MLPLAGATVSHPLNMLKWVVILKGFRFRSAPCDKTIMYPDNG